MHWATLFTEMTRGIVGLVSEPGRILMMAIGGLLIYLAVAKEYETLLIPIGLGCIWPPYGAGMGILEHSKECALECHLRMPTPSGPVQRPVPGRHHQ